MFETSWPSASNFKSFSSSLEHFFLTVGQNNFGNKIPWLDVADFLWVLLCSSPEKHLREKWLLKRIWVRITALPDWNQSLVNMH